MRRAWTTWLAWGLWVLTALLSTATLVLRGLIEATDSSDPSQYVVTVVAANFTFMAFATVGALVASRRPGNAIGWIFCVAPVLCQLSNVVDEYSTAAGERGWPGVVWPSVVLAPTWVVGFELVSLFGLLLFPDGALPSPRWRFVGVAGGLVVAMSAVAGWLAPGPIVGAPGHDNPIGIPGMGVVFSVSLLAFVVVLVSVLVSVVVRFRHSSEIEREQLRLFLGATGFVAIFLGTLAGLSRIGPVRDALGGAFDILFLLALAVIPMSIGAAILRYRLYEIDRIISKTLVYGALTAVLGAAYAGLVLAGQALAPSFGGSNLAIAGSTLAVAALFLPVRSRVQRFVDRRFYRRRYDAQRTLESFGARLRQQTDLGTLELDLRSAVSETMQPVHVTLWRREMHG